MRTVKINGAGGYEVDLADDGNHRVYTMMPRKPAGFGYSYADGATHYRREIKATAALGKRMIKEAQAQVSQPWITDEQVQAYIAAVAAADCAAGIE